MVVPVSIAIAVPAVPVGLRKEWTLVYFNKAVSIGTYSGNVYPISNAVSTALPTFLDININKTIIIK